MITREDVKESYIVTGLLKVLHHSQVNFDYVLPLIIINEYFGNPTDPGKGIDGDWNNYDFEMYVRLTPRTSAEAVAATLTQLQKKNTSDDLTKTLKYNLQPLAKIHLYNPNGSDGLITMVRIFTWLVIVILLIASINYINLTTAKAAQRAKEIGVRKIIGAGRRQLFFRFLSESFTVFFSCNGGVYIADNARVHAVQFTVQKRTYF